MNPKLRRLSPVVASCVLLAAFGCNNAGPHLSMDAPETAAAVELLMPKSIQIQTFTQPISAAGDGQADAIEVILAVNDCGGDPVKVVGTFQFELLKRRLTSADRIPQRVAYWREEVVDADSYNMHWDPYSRGYRFALHLSQAPLPAGEYELRAQLTSLTGEHLFHQREMKFDGHSAPPLTPRF